MVIFFKRALIFYRYKPKYIQVIGYNNMCISFRITQERVEISVGKDMNETRMAMY